MNGENKDINSIRELKYAGVDMTFWDFTFCEDDEIFIYKTFVALCNYAEEHIPCGKCPLYGKLCCCNTTAAINFWNKVSEKLKDYKL